MITRKGGGDFICCEWVPQFNLFQQVKLSMEVYLCVVF